MKKLFLTIPFVSLFVFLILLLLPWNVNFAKSECDGILQKTFCKNSLIITQKPITENTMQDVQGMFPFDDLIIKI